MTDIEVLARTLWGEARGEGRDGMIAVANVVMNRVHHKRWPDTVSAVAQQAFQFSCWNTNDPNRQKMLDVTDSDPVYREALAIANDAIEGNLFDLTNGADHYHEKSITPSWARGQRPIVIIGNHHFYKLT